MDYHFYNSPQKKKENPFKIIAFAPLFVLAAFLPVMIYFVGSPTPDLDTSASSDELVLWIDPPVSETNSSMEFTVYARHEGSSPSLVGLSTEVRAVSPDNEQLIFNLSQPKPFTGVIEVGKIKLDNLERGTTTLTFAPNSTQLLNSPSALNIKTSQATVDVP
jgi:hypothetical protein